MAREQGDRPALATSLLKDTQADCTPRALHPFVDVDGLLAAVYRLLAGTLDVVAADPTYVLALSAVLKAAQATERGVKSLTTLPLLACQAAGGAPTQAVPMSAAWRSIHIAAKLLDDVEDGDVALISKSQAGGARVTNLATGFIGMANLALAALAPDVWRYLQHSLQITGIQMAGAQHRELTIRAAAHPDSGLDGYLEVVGGKAGRFFALAARGGARCATDDPRYLSAFDTFGHNVGVMLQFADDYADWHSDAATNSKGDLAMGHYTAPVYYALDVASPGEKARLLELLALVRHEVDARAEVRRLVIALGAETYLRAQVARCKSNAVQALETLDSSISATGPLHMWLNRVLADVQATTI